MTNDTRDEELIHDYAQFCKDVAQCYAYLVAGRAQPEYTDKAYMLMAVTIGQAIGFGQRIGISSPIFKEAEENYHKQLTTSAHSIEQQKPWDKLHISRSTYYRDLRRAKQAGTPND